MAMEQSQAHVKREYSNAAAYKAVCKINHPRQSELGTGFLGEFVTVNGSLVHGLFTNSHILPEHCLADDHTIVIEFDDSNPPAEIADASTNPPASLTKTVNTTGLFRFTCPILDTTFLKLEDKDIEYLTSNGCHFLQITSSWEGVKDASVLLLRYSGDACKHSSQAQGSFIKYYGLDMFYSVSGDKGSSGLPVVLADGQVIGLQKDASIEKYGVAVTMKAIIKALHPYFASPSFPHYLIHNPISLELSYAARLLDIGLKQTNFEGLVYVSPAHINDDGIPITAIWFVPTSHGWYWTPTDPSHSTKLTNWMSVSQEQVVGGGWRIPTPAPENVKIIRWLHQHPVTGNPSLQ